jgi:hypothetical protein
MVYVHSVEGTATYPQFYCECNIYVTGFNRLINKLMVENLRFTILGFTCVEAARDVVASSNLQNHSLTEVYIQSLRVLCVCVCVCARAEGTEYRYII